MYSPRSVSRRSPAAPPGRTFSAPPRLDLARERRTYSFM